MSLETRGEGGNRDAVPLAQRRAKPSRYNVSDKVCLLSFGCILAKKYAVSRGIVT